MIRYKIDVIEVMKKNGYSMYRIRKEKILSSCVLKYIREGKDISLSTLNKICLMCHMQPGDILEVIPTDEEKQLYYDLANKPHAKTGPKKSGA